MLPPQLSIAETPQRFRYRSADWMYGTAALHIGGVTIPCTVALRGVAPEQGLVGQGIGFEAEVRGSHLDQLSMDRDHEWALQVRRGDRFTIVASGMVRIVP